MMKGCPSETLPPQRYPPWMLVPVSSQMARKPTEGKICNKDAFAFVFFDSTISSLQLTFPQTHLHLQLLAQ
ncbi:hypothetical protein QVD17_02826 [Tagetes erecta]|uniref:Uncharacterized protein n=1 Tax=Tagetes erecta TaxID=13708 RepID=A0AAD8P9H6_TARER|nr:hypothetical protein QVD17_02826 [Tagetes erecta]